MKYARIGMIAAVIGASAVLMGCASSPSANTYVRSSVMSEMRVELATVEAVRRVRIESGQGGVGTGAGAAVGAIAGSGLGSNVRDAAVGAIAGAVVGGVAGLLTDRAVNNHEGLEIVYRLESGDTRVLVQALEGSEDIKQGDRIRLIKGQYTTRAVKI